MTLLQPLLEEPRDLVEDETRRPSRAPGAGRRRRWPASRRRRSRAAAPSNGDSSGAPKVMLPTVVIPPARAAAEPLAKSSTHAGPSDWRGGSTGARAHPRRPAARSFPRASTSTAPSISPPIWAIRPPQCPRRTTAPSTSVPPRTTRSNASLACRVSAAAWTIDAVVVGGGRTGWRRRSRWREPGSRAGARGGRPTVGGGLRSAELTLPGFAHDVCAAVHAAGARLALFPHAAAGPLRAATWCSRAARWPIRWTTARRWSSSGRSSDRGRPRRRWQPRIARLMQPLVAVWRQLLDQLLGPLALPRHPLALARFGLAGAAAGHGLARIAFRGPRARALFGRHGGARDPAARAPGLGRVRAGAGDARARRRLADPARRGAAHGRCAASATCSSLGGQIATEQRGRPRSTSCPAPRGAARPDPAPGAAWRADACAAAIGASSSGYRYGPGVFKIDWALDGPIPWTAHDCRAAGTVHLGGTLAEIAAVERAVWRGRHAAGRSCCWRSRACSIRAARRPGKHTAWAYCHVPNGSTRRHDARDRGADRALRARVRRDASSPAPRARAAEMEAYNAELRRRRHQRRRRRTCASCGRAPPRGGCPYSTPDPRLFLCSSSTPPGGGVHGMCGYHAARAALRRLR